MRRRYSTRSLDCQESHIPPVYTREALFFLCKLVLSFERLRKGPSILQCFLVVRYLLKGVKSPAPKEVLDNAGTKMLYVILYNRLRCRK